MIDFYWIDRHTGPDSWMASKTDRTYQVDGYNGLKDIVHHMQDGRTLDSLPYSAGKLPKQKGPI